MSNANDDSEFSVHGIHFSNSGSSSCALSVTVTQPCLIDKLQRLVTLSASVYICAFVYVILLRNVCDFGLLNNGFFVNLDFFLVILNISRVVHETFRSYAS